MDKEGANERSKIQPGAQDSEHVADESFEIIPEDDICDEGMGGQPNWELVPGMNSAAAAAALVSESGEAAAALPTMTAPAQETSVQQSAA